MRKVAAGGVGLVCVVLAVYVAVGMIGGANPDFSRGDSPLGSVVLQELAGTVTLPALSLTLVEAVRVWRGKRASALLILFPIGLLLAVVWAFALIVERAS